MEGLEQQVKVSRMLGLAFVFSITSIFGVGSIVAVILGWRALRIIRGADRRISGQWLAWWCILAGALGALIVTPLTVATIVRQIK
jgi:uncharacterized membrane protein YdcZ (DUF606 family)